MAIDFSPMSKSDTAKLMSLIQEYSDKLRALCVAYADTRAKRQQIVLASATLLTVIAAVSAFSAKLFVPSADINSSAFSIIAALLGAGVAIIPLLWVAPQARARSLYDVHQVASTVERLLRTASQYSEHAAQTLGDKFEFDIRLAEAEAALHVYRNVFGEGSKRPGSFF